MKVGFALPHQGPVATRDNMRLVATEAELMGYDSLGPTSGSSSRLRPRRPTPETPGASSTRSTRPTSTT
jgi:hypothetical protein